jgi:hypothetical protein
MSFIVDTPLNISLHLSEPLPPAPISSHHRFLSRFPDWKGMPQQYKYSLEIPLQPGINHVMWCMHGQTSGMTISSTPPSGGDWPAVSPHPISPEYVIRYYSLKNIAGATVSMNKYCESTRSRFSSYSYLHSYRPPHAAVYSPIGEVPSLLKTAMMVVISQGLLLPNVRRAGNFLPQRLVDVTYHHLRVVAMDGTVIH